ncbi:MAG: HEAT repeat domain-containing protein [Thermodesulfovibrionales bacterium]|nr:HEAT repeat domain-containing protein [Thermodesulfovibrionales bacterium]
MNCYKLRYLLIRRYIEMPWDSYKTFFAGIFCLAVLIFLIPDHLYAGKIDKVIHDIENGDWHDFLSNIEKFRGIKDERLIDALNQHINDLRADWTKRVKVIHLMGEIGNHATADVLIRILNDPFLHDECPAVKWNTVAALGKFKNQPRVVDALIDELNYDNLVIREAVIESLGELGDPKAVPFFISYLNNKSFAIKMSAIKALAKIKDPRALPYLKNISDSDNDQFIKSEAIKALSSFKN